MPLVYSDLKRRASAYLRRERPDHTLQTTALVHETFMRLAGQNRVAWQNRSQFFGIAAQMMRRILVDHARVRRATKRQGDPLRLEAAGGIAVSQPRGCDILALDEALNDLTRRDARQARIVELRYFGGLTEQEVADVLAISRTTVTRDWLAARAWLYRRMTAGPSSAE